MWPVGQLSVPALQAVIPQPVVQGYMCCSTVTVASILCGCREEYFGLRVRKLHDSAQAINIPVNTTVGPSGAPLEALFVLYALV